MPEQSVQVLDDAALKALLKACDGKDFVARRDAAIIRTFLDTGARLAELAGLTLAQLDLAEDVILVLGKGPPRTCPAVRRENVDGSRQVPAGTSSPPAGAAGDRL